MSTIEQTKKHLSDLLSEYDQLLELTRGEDIEILKFGSAYQRWYSKALKLVELLGPDRLDEFVSYYSANPKRKRMDAGTFTIQDFLRGLGPAPDALDRVPFDTNNLAAILLTNQFQILSSLSDRIDSILADVTGHLLAELQDTELRAASTLAKVSPRAAGALAGVVLERHLQRVAKNHHVSIRKKTPTIADLNDPLKAKGVYDVPTWRKVQMLADLRNLCVHQKGTEPSDAQVTEMIVGVSAIIKSVF